MTSTRIYAVAAIVGSLSVAGWAYGSFNRVVAVGNGIIYRHNALTGFESFCRVQDRYSMRLECAYPATQRKIYRRAAERVDPTDADAVAAHGEAMRRGLTPP